MKSQRMRPRNDETFSPEGLTNGSPSSWKNHQSVSKRQRSWLGLVPPLMFSNRPVAMTTAEIKKNPI